MTILPPDITSKAFVASNGELALCRQDIEHALEAIRNSGRAILGGEVWLVSGAHSWSGLIPQRKGGPPAVWHWETALHSSTEPWEKYCERTTRESVDAVRSMDVEQETLPELIDRLRFNVTSTGKR